MKAVVQRVKTARVSVDGEEISCIDRGLLILLGIKKNDNEEIAKSLAQRCANLRIFEDEKGKMNHSVFDIKGSIMVVSQFTLYGDTTHGRRPSFTAAENPERAKSLYEYFIDQLKKLNLTVASGQFGARMLVELQNDGPVTLILTEGDKDD